MARTLLPLVAAAACTQAFVSPETSRSAAAYDVRLNAVLEGREIEGALTPTNNFVLVKIAPIEDETEGGILLTGSVSLSVSIRQAHGSFKCH